MIKEIGNEMKSYINDLKDNIKNKEELNYLLDRTEKLFDSIFNELNKYADEEEKKLKELKTKQKRQEKRMDEIETKMEYLDENNQDEIYCPECNNIIELDWSDDTENL